MNARINILLKAYIFKIYLWFLGIKFTQSDIYVQISILNKLCNISIHQSSFEEVLSDLQLIWTNFIKKQD